MVKWKKMNKKMAGLLLGVMMLFTASTTAFAYVDESAEASKVETTQTDQSTDKEEKKDEAASTNEALPEDGTDQGTAFTTPGNGEVNDHEFLYCWMRKSCNVFYGFLTVGLMVKLHQICNYSCRNYYSGCYR